VPPGIPGVGKHPGIGMSAVDMADEGKPAADERTQSRLHAAQSTVLVSHFVICADAGAARIKHTHSGEATVPFRTYHRVSRPPSVFPTSSAYEPAFRSHFRHMRTDGRHTKAPA
jgi:hypothetical protein